MNRLREAISLYSAQGQRKYLNPAERARFLVAARQAEPAIRTFCLTLAFTGCRVSEALRLRGCDVQPEVGLISILCLKKRGRVVVREIPVPDALLSEIQSVRRGEVDGCLQLIWPWGRTRAWHNVKMVMRAAGIEHLAASPKGLRHAFGVHAVCSGVPLNLIQKWLGHEDIATTAIYTAALGPEERAIAGRMW